MLTSTRTYTATEFIFISPTLINISVPSRRWEDLAVVQGPWLQRITAGSTSITIIYVLRRRIIHAGGQEVTFS